MSVDRSQKPGPRLARLVCAALCLCSAAFVSGCAGLGSERNLAPVFSELSTAGGGTAIEALGGAVILKRDRPHGFVTEWALRPLIIRDQQPTGDFVMRYLTPFGRAEREGPDYGWYLLPITLYNQRYQADGAPEFTLITLPGIYWSRTADGRTLRAWFPFGGVLERFLSFDRIEFVLFPLWLRTERSGRVTHHLLWPFFSWTTGAGGPSWHVWPIVGNNIYEGRYERWFVLWPIVEWERNRLWAPEDEIEHRWGLFPLYSEVTQKNYEAHTLLWPFFGWSSNPDTGFWAWDGPWPLVRLERDPEHDISRTRFWPFWSTYHGDGLDSDWYLWPFINVRHEEYDKTTKDALFVIPFWQKWDRVDEDTGRSSWRKLWPLLQIDQPEEHQRRVSFPALNPLWRTPEIDDMYAWMWELYSRETDHERIHERTWLGLWRREKDENEDRRSITCLWGIRDWRDEEDRKVRDHSLLFGLFRWRTREDGMFRGLPPALPGPGWPLEREARKKAP